MTETKTLRKGYKIHFLKRNEYETITKTKNANNSQIGEIVTDKNEYSVDFIQRWLSFGFLKIYKP